MVLRLRSSISTPKSALGFDNMEEDIEKLKKVYEGAAQKYFDARKAYDEAKRAYKAALKAYEYADKAYYCALNKKRRIK